MVVYVVKEDLWKCSELVTAGALEIILYFILVENQLPSPADKIWGGNKALQSADNNLEKECGSI